jgi:DNA-binding transcriptional regulator YiaG
MKWEPPRMTGQELRAIREFLGLTQDKMGKRMGVYGRTVRKWENNERVIPGPAVELARILHEGLNKS